MTHDRFFSSLNQRARAPLALAMAALMVVTPLGIPGVTAQSADDPAAMAAAQDSNSQGQDGTSSLGQTSGLLPRVRYEGSFHWRGV